MVEKDDNMSILAILFFLFVLGFLVTTCKQCMRTYNPDDNVPLEYQRQIQEYNNRHQPQEVPPKYEDIEERPPEY
jgi:hypothetical protein